MRAPRQKKYDVFFSHNHADKESVEYIANKLTKETDLEIFLDKWVLVPVETFRNALSNGLEQPKSCTVLFGKNFPKGWLEEEINKAINLQTKNKKYRVIPVLLPSAKKELVAGFLQSRNMG